MEFKYSAFLHLTLVLFGWQTLTGVGYAQNSVAVDRAGQGGVLIFPSGRSINLFSDRAGLGRNGRRFRSEITSPRQQLDVILPRVLRDVLNVFDPDEEMQTKPNVLGFGVLD